MGRGKEGAFDMLIPRYVCDFLTFAAHKSWAIPDRLRHTRKNCTKLTGQRPASERDGEEWVSDKDGYRVGREVEGLRH